jgi:SAM-dependent methyltransferase
MGAGTMAIARKLGCSEVFGVDFVHTYLREAQARGVHTFYVDLSLDALPFEDNSFDAILCSEVIEHVVDSDHVLREIRRVLSRDGVCVITTPNLASWIDRVALSFFGWQPFSTSASFQYDVGRPRFLSQRTVGKHLRVLTYRGLLELLRLHGFAVIDVRGARAFTVQDLARLVRDQHTVTTVKLLRGLLTSMAILLDWFAVFRPSLAAGLVAAIRKTG